MFMLHAADQPREFKMPQAAAGQKWRLFIDTAAEPPGDIYPEADGPMLDEHPDVLDGHTLRCYVAE
jgi:glycogen operon protein